MTVCKVSPPRAGKPDDTYHLYRLKLDLLVMQTEEKEPEPVENVAAAVSQLLEDNAYSWLLEAIGHPNAGAFQAIVLGQENSDV